MLDDIPTYTWMVVDIILLAGVCLAIVLLGHIYGSDPNACGAPLTVASWVLDCGALGVLVVMGITVVRTGLDGLGDLLSNPFFWVGVALLVGGWLGWEFLDQLGWTC